VSLPNRRRAVPFDCAEEVASLVHARKALLALVAGAHHERTVDPRWVVAIALQGLGAGKPPSYKPYIIKKGERT
jgi:hypothetical protein